ncbi:RhoGAP-domain-containing protein [Backusella circina FSU 941]|nr:RhoGAP-domain-containing protein [Backusella circina FSU 941]
MQPLFGSRLSTSLARCRHKTSEGYLVPALLAICFNEIETRGLELEGLFRKSGSMATVNQLQLDFEQNPFLNKFPYTISSHSLAGVFKRYLQLLPDPVIPKQCQKQLLQVYDEYHQHDILLKQRLKHLLSTILPLEHLHLFQFLVSVADKIQQHQERNQMTIEALAILFAPTCVHITEREPRLPLFVQRAKRLFTTKKRSSFQDVIQLDLIKESIKWTKVFEMILSDPGVFANLTTNNTKMRSPSFIPIMLEKTHTSTKTIDSSSYWHMPDTESFISSHDLECDAVILGGNERQAVAQQ